MPSHLVLLESSASRCQLRPLVAEQCIDISGWRFRSPWLCCSAPPAQRGEQMRPRCGRLSTLEVLG